MSASKSTRNFLIFGSVFGIALVGFVIYLAVLFLAAPNETTPTKDGSQNDDVVSTSEVPEIISFEVKRDTDTSLTATAIGVIATGDYHGQYKIVDLNKKTVAKGNLPEDGNITATVDLANGGNSFVLQIRVEGKGSYSEYVSSEPSVLSATGLPEKETINTQAKPNEEYFNTLWGKGSGGQDDLTEAVKIAWGASVAGAADYCMPLNNAVVSPGEIIAPLPSVPPSDYDLKFEVGPALNGQFQIYYYWCVKPE